MPLDLVDYQTKTREAVQAFWGNREKARQKQIEAGKVDAGERSGVTAGKNMDGFISLIIDLVNANGLSHAVIHQKRRLLTLPGFFRPTKLWDLVITHEGRLIAAVELKSHIGPSFGNNCNNRAEEAIGTAHDFWTAYRDGAFGKHPRPFLGWFILVEDAVRSRTPVKERSPHFGVFPEFLNASYLQRYNILCQKLIQENLYTAASVISSPRSAISDGIYGELHELTGLSSFVTSFAGHIASEAARNA